MSGQIYLDYNSTTPIDERVLKSMSPYIGTHLSNSDNTTNFNSHFNYSAVESSKAKIANFLGCDPYEIYFTSGSTESINFIIKEIIENYSVKGKHIITAITEHKAVLDICFHLEEKRLAELTLLKVDPEGNIDLNELENSIRTDTVMVVLMHANHVTGVIHPVEQIAEICKRKGLIFFSDTTQSAGKLRINVNEIGFDAACLSGHKMYGPKGIGAVYIRGKNLRIIRANLIHGARHDKLFRGEESNVAGFVGLAKACEIAGNEMWEDNTKVSKLRGKFEHQILDFKGVRIVGGTRNRLYNTSTIFFEGKNQTELINQLKHFDVGFGSSNNQIEKPSFLVLKAMGLNEVEARSCIRFSFGKYTTETETENLIETIKKIYQYG